MKENAKLTQALDTLKSVPDRDPAVVRQNRAAFLQEAAQLSAQPVSNSLFARLNNKYRLIRPQMQFSTLTIAILLAALMLTFSSGVYAARKSAPSQFLYPVKLWLEDSRLSLTRDPHERNDLLLDYAEERLNELEGFTGDSTDPDLTSAMQNFDEYYLTLSEEYDLDDVQEQRWENIQEQYQLIHPEDDEEDEQDSDSEDQSDETEQPEDQSDQDEHPGPDDQRDAPNDTINSGDDQSESNAEDTSSEDEPDSSSEENTSNQDEEDQESSEDSPKETQTPEDDSEDGEEDSTDEPTDEPDPTPDDEPASNDSTNDD